MASMHYLSDLLAQCLCLIFSGLIGCLVGFEFPCVNRLYLAESEQPHPETGVIYAADLFGSCAGALLVSVFLIPIFGTQHTLLILFAVNCLVSFQLFFAKNLGGKNV